MVRIPFPKGISEAGLATTGADGVASITFLKAYPTKPKVALSPDVPHGTDVVTTQIEGWTLDAEGKYIGMAVFTGDDAGKPEPSVPVHYLVVE